MVNSSLFYNTKLFINQVQGELMKKSIYWFLSLTWGVIMTLIGAIIILCLLLTGHKVKRFGYDLYINVGNNWGGGSFGPFFITDNNDRYSIKCHEHGHGFQNCKLGPLFPFLVAIPSASRYWLREIATQKGKIIYSTILSFCFIAIGVALLSSGFVINNTLLKILGIFIVSYFVILWVWLALIETPKYKNNKHVDYDSFWPEGDATRTGTEFMKSLQQKESSK